jgi:hypothetical protein
MVVCAGPVLLVADVNGRPLGAAHTGSHIVSCAMAEVPEWMDGRVVVTGHIDGIVRVWQLGFWEYGRKLELDAAIARREDATSASGVSTLESFMKELYAGVPFCLKLQAMLDWHANPVTSVLITQYVHEIWQPLSLSPTPPPCICPATTLPNLCVCAHHACVLRRAHVLVTGDAAGNVIEWKRGDAQ